MTAHACLTGAPAHATAAKAVAMAHEGHCAGVAQSAAPIAAGRQRVRGAVHGRRAVRGGAGPAAGRARRTAGRTGAGRAVDRRTAWDAEALAATRAQPPPQLQFGRFLI